MTLTYSLTGMIALAATVSAGPGEWQSSANRRDGGGVEVHVAPAVTSPGTTVRIDGRSAIDDASRLVRITVTLPDRSQAPLVVKAGENGDFETTFDKTNTAGKYGVAVFSPGGLDHGETTFVVGLPATIQQDLIVEHEELGKTAEKAIRTVEAVLKALPASPPKEELLEKLSPLKSEVAKWPDESTRFKNALDSLRTAGETSHGFGAIVYSEVFNPLSLWRDESRPARTHVNDELTRGDAATLRCDSIDHAGEALKALALVVNLIARPGGLILRAMSLSANTIASVEPDAEKRIVIARVIKTLPPLFTNKVEMLRSGPVQWDPVESRRVLFSGAPNVAMGWITDLTRLATQRVFARYCEKFAGPVSGTMHGEYLRAGVPWWKFDETLRGKLTLRYPKTESAGGAIHVSGEFVGNITELKAWDDALPVLEPKLSSSGVFFKRAVLPKVGDFVERFLQQQGALVNAYAPGGFSIPVEGDLVDTKMTLSVKPATVDMQDLEAKVLYVVLSPLTLAPVAGRYGINFMPAHHIITRALATDPFEVRVVVDRPNNVMTIERDFSATRGSRTGTAYGEYSLKINLKNPPS
jgi:hypothetical protein